MTFQFFETTVQTEISSGVDCRFTCCLLAAFKICLCIDANLFCPTLFQWKLCNGRCGCPLVDLTGERIFSCQPD